MEEKRSVLSQFSGIIRLIAFIVLVLIVLFFVFRWVSNKRAENRAEQAVKTATSSNSAEEKESNTTKEKEAQEQKSKKTENQGVVEVPSGVSDSNVPAPTTNTVPAAGMGEDILLTCLFISATVFLLFKNYDLNKQIKSV